MPNNNSLICVAMCFLVVKISYMYDVEIDVCNMYYLSIFFIVGQAKKKVQLFIKRNMKSLVTLKVKSLFCTLQNVNKQSTR